MYYKNIFLAKGWLIAFAVLIFCTSVQAQRRFQGGVVVGLSASQIDGDLMAGYDKLGLIGGIRTVARLKERSDLSVEFLFAQRGAQTDLVKDKYNPNHVSLTLNYVEVPVQWHYKDWLVEGEKESDNYHKVSFNGGFSYARFIGQRIRGEESWFEGIVPNYFIKTDVSLLLGFNFFANKNLGFTVRYVRSLNLMYDPRDWNPAPAQRGWLGHCIYFQTAYML